MAGTLKPTKQSDFELVVAEAGRALCANLPSYHLCEHFSVHMLYFNRKFPPKLICGLWEASSGGRPEGHKRGILLCQTLQLLFQLGVQGSASPPNAGLGSHKICLPPVV